MLKGKVCTEKKIVHAQKYICPSSLGSAVTEKIAPLEQILLAALKGKNLLPWSKFFPLRVASNFQVVPLALLKTKIIVSFWIVNDYGK